jgi:hypothetical protein
MTTIATVTPPTLRTLLFSEGAEPVTTLAESMNAGGISNRLLGAIGGISSPARREVVRQVATVTLQTLDLDVVDLVIGGWRTHARLVAAARRTLAVSGSEEVVDLVSHSIRSVHWPALRLDPAGRRPSGAAGLGGGRRLRHPGPRRGGASRPAGGTPGGQCELTALLAAEGVQLAHRHQPIDLRLALPLRTGIQLTTGDTSRLHTPADPGH